MAYGVDTWTFPGSIEKEYKWIGKYGAKGEKRQKKARATPEQIRKQNQRNREKRVRRLIKANFEPEDLWVALKYPKGTRKSPEEVAEDFEKFRDRVRAAYRKQGYPFRYIYRMEIGKLGGVHIHILVNRVRGKPETDLIIQREWKHGQAHFQSIYDRGGYADLAEYIVKEPDEETEQQLSIFPDAERKKLIKYSTSRNLVRPAPVRKRYSHWIMRRILEDGPKPTTGYYIDQDSIVSGVNPYTGMSYLQYTEYPLQRGSPGRRWKDDG